MDLLRNYLYQYLDDVPESVLTHLRSKGWVIYIEEHSYLNNGYEVGTILQTNFKPIINGNHILLTTNDIKITSKFDTTTSLINSNEWQLIFRLKR